MLPTAQINIDTEKRRSEEREDDFIGRRIEGQCVPGQRYRNRKITGWQESGNCIFHYGSVNSRNRVFTETEDGIRTEAADPSKLTDPHLIIYAPVRVLGNKTIVTNGDQTDTIYELMDKQQTFEQSLRTREYEDDAPNYTPRISGIMHVENGSYNYAMSILKSADGNPDCCERFTFSYTNPLSGTGHFIHTYMGDGNPLPSFEGEPKLVAIPDDMDAFTDMLWNSLNEDNKVSLFVRYIDIETGKATSKIINKYDRV